MITEYEKREASISVLRSSKRVREAILENNIQPDQIMKMEARLRQVREELEVERQQREKICIWIQKVRDAFPKLTRQEIAYELARVKYGVGTAK